MERKDMERKSSRALILTLTTFTYLLLGAAVFNHLESEEDGKVREEIAHIRERLQRKYNFSERDQGLFEAIVVKGIPHKAGYQWQFAGAFYFATVVITTVGYGHSSPSTMGGKLFCMVFALAGIPMGLIMFQSIGERVNTGIAYCLHKLKDHLHARGSQKLKEVTPKHLLFVSLSIGTTIIVIGTYVFHTQERWDMFDAYYYCFVTLSTIGFGDYVPVQQSGALQRRPGYLIFTLLFILIGLAVFSACVNLLVLGFMAQNADEVTASQRDPPGAIILERFTNYSRSRSNSLVDSQLFNLRKVSRDIVAANNVKRQNRQLSLPRESPPVGVMYNATANHRWSWMPDFAVDTCSLCNKSKMKKSITYRGSRPFTLKRPPTNNISHLISTEM